MTLFSEIHKNPFYSLHGIFHFIYSTGLHVDAPRIAPLSASPTTIPTMSLDPAPTIASHTAMLMDLEPSLPAADSPQVSQQDEESKSEENFDFVS